MIPWSYIFTDDVWNLVLSCQDCNLKKSNSLPERPFVRYLIERDGDYYHKMDIMKKSIDQLSFKGDWEKEIKNHYEMCHDYGFGRKSMRVSPNA